MAHRLLGINHTVVHTYVDHLRTGLDLRACNAHSLIEVTLAHQTRKLSRTRHIRALANVDKVRLGHHAQLLQATQRADVLFLALCTRRVATNDLREFEYMFGCCAAATTHDIDQSATQILLNIVRKHLGRLVIATHHIGQTRIRVRRHSILTHLRQTLQVGQHLTRAIGAVEAHSQRLGVRHRGIERLNGLSRQRATTRIGQRARDHQRNLRAQLLAEFLNGIDRRLGIERIEYRFEQQQIDTSLNQRTSLNAICFRQLLECNPARRRVVHIGRNRRRAIRGTHRTCHQTRFRGVGSRITIGHRARHLRRRTIQLGNVLL